VSVDEVDRLFGRVSSGRELHADDGKQTRWQAIGSAEHARGRCQFDARTASNGWRQATMYEADRCDVGLEVGERFPGRLDRLRNDVVTHMLGIAGYEGL